MRYKHKPTGDIVEEVKNKSGYYKNIHIPEGQLICGKYIIGCSDWEEIKEKREWAILSVRYSLYPDALYINDGTDTFKYQVGTINLSLVKEGRIGSNKITIHSVRRESDGEVFTVGDRVISSPFPSTKITKITIENNVVFVWGFFNQGMEGNLILKSIRKVEKSFTTEDGVDIYEGDPVVAVYTDFSIFTYEQWKNYYDSFKGTKYFSTEEKAKEYVEWNRPQFSKKDMQTIYNRIDPIGCDREWFKDNYLEKIS